MAEYGLAIDDNRLEDWVELFDEDCDYKVVTRENVEQGLPKILMWCQEQEHAARPRSSPTATSTSTTCTTTATSSARSTSRATTSALWQVEVSYSLFQTELEGVSLCLFSVGKYRVEALVEGLAGRLKSVTVIADTGLVPSLLATPI